MQYYTINQGLTMTNFREITDTLRNPNGPYFAENTPAMLALESMVDTVGLANVLYAVAQIAREKAEHLASAWQDENTAKRWGKMAGKIERVAPFASNV
jgi:hypothetical protein